MLYDRAPSTPETGHPCWYCQHYDGPAWGDTTLARCIRDGVHCKAQAEIGCAFFEREPGVDDDGWAPLPMVYPKMGR